MDQLEIEDGLTILIEISPTKKENKIVFIFSLYLDYLFAKNCFENLEIKVITFLNSGKLLIKISIF